MAASLTCRYILANSNVEVPCHLVDIQMPVYPAGTEGSWIVLTIRKTCEEN